MTLRRAEAVVGAADSAVAEVVAAGLAEVEADLLVGVDLGEAEPDRVVAVLGPVGEQSDPVGVEPGPVEALSDRVEVQFVRAEVGREVHLTLGADAPVREIFQTLVWEPARRSVPGRTLAAEIVRELEGILRKSEIDQGLAVIGHRSGLSQE